MLSATDVGPSGVKEIHYTVNGGTEQVAAGASTSVSVPLSGTGTASVKYYAVDVAGNVEPSQAVALKYDNIAPTVTHTVNPKANASDWNNSDVTVHFDAKDTDPGSGVAAGSVTPDQVISSETSSHRSRRQRLGQGHRRQHRHRLGDGQARQDQAEHQRLRSSAAPWARTAGTSAR